MEIKQYVDSEGNQVTETYDARGNLTARTMISANGDVTNVANGGSTGIQAAVVNGKNVRR